MHKTDYTEWYKMVYPRLTGFGLWLRGGEINTLPPGEYYRRRFRILIARLSPAADAAESLTHQLLYGLAKSISDTYPDMAFLPPKNDLRFFERDGVPWLLGTGAKRGPMDFDMVAISNSIVQELINLPVMLEKSGIPLEKSKRIKESNIPLILLGGANALWTSCYWTDDPPVDGIFVGESIECIEKIFTICRNGKQKGLNKEIVLKELDSIPGFFQPDRIRNTRKQSDLNLADQTFFPDQPVSYLENQPGRGTVAISEGCPSICSFCSESFVRKPYREVPAGIVIERAIRMKAAMGLDRIELSSFNFNVHRDVYQIIDGLTDVFDTVGLKSMRFDVLAHDSRMLPWLLAAGKTSLACGLEGISPRLRRYLHKNLSDQDLFRSLRTILAAPVRELKIFLIATGREEGTDFDAFENLLKFISAGCTKLRHTPRILFSATPLVRFSWTPLEFENAPRPEQMQNILDAIEKIIRKNGFESRRAMDVSEWWLSQVLVRASGSGLSAALIRAVHKSNFIYHRTLPASFIRTFNDELLKEGINQDLLLADSESAVPMKKPWMQIETGMSRDYLFDQYQKSLAFKDDGSCIGKSEQDGVCRPCGARSDQGLRNQPASKRYKATTSADKLLEKHASFRRDEQSVNFLIDVAEQARGLPRKAVGTALASAFMLAESEWIPAYRRYQTSFWEKTNPMPWITGEDGITLVFRCDLLPGLVSCLEDAEFVKIVNERFDRWGEFKGVLPSCPEKIKIEVESPFRFDGKVFLQSTRLTHTLRKMEENKYRYDLTPEALKKNIIKEMTHDQKRDGSCEIRLIAGPKFDPALFAKKAFILPHPSDWIRIRMRSKFISEKN